MGDYETRKKFCETVYEVITDDDDGIEGVSPSQAIEFGEALYEKIKAEGQIKIKGEIMESNLDACQTAVGNLEDGQGNPQFVLALLLLEIAVQLSELRQTFENRPA